MEDKPVRIDWFIGVLIEICACPMGVQRQERTEKELGEEVMFSGELGRCLVIRPPPACPKNTAEGS